MGPDNDGIEDTGSYIEQDLSGDTDYMLGVDGNDDVTIDDASLGTDDGQQPPAPANGQQTAQVQGQQGQQPPQQMQTQQPAQTQNPQGQQQQPPQGSQQQSQQGQQQPQPQQPASFGDYVERNKEQLVSQLAEKVFALSDQEVEDVQNDPKTAIPKLLARAYLVSAVQTQQSLQQTLPSVVGRLIQVTQDASRHENDFFTAYPSLKSIPVQQVAATAQMLRQNNANLTKEEFMPLLARTVAAMHQVPLPPVPGRPMPPAPPAASHQRGMSHQRGQQEIVEPLYDINMALRNGD